MTERNRNPAAQDRASRLAAQLRANLHRRKAQARAAAQAKPEPPEQG